MKKKFKPIIVLAAILLICCAIAAFIGYRFVFGSNIYVTDAKYLYIADNADFQTVRDSLYKNFDVKNKSSFEFVAEKKNYPNKIKGGRYKISNAMSNNALVNMLRSGNQCPVNLTFNNLRTVKQLCSTISKQLPVDSTKLYNLLQDNEFLKQYGFNSVNVGAMFIPDTYQFYWNTDEEKFIKKMYGTYCKFWTDERKAKAKAINLSQLEVSILASIVQSEQAAHKEEQPIIAGIYLNRLRIEMPLQSCPTLIYALGDFSIRRLSFEMLETESPYNTYKNPGLPPSCINFPEIPAIEAVLNPQKTDYLYMCAKSDFSGYHHFSVSYNEHVRFANQFRKELDNRKIYK